MIISKPFLLFLLLLPPQQEPQQLHDKLEDGSYLVATAIFFLIHTLYYLSYTLWGPATVQCFPACCNTPRGYPRLLH